MVRTYKIFAPLLLTVLFNCMSVNPPEAPVPEASLKHVWVNNGLQRKEGNSYLWRDGHRITKKRKAIWVESHWIPTRKGLRYIPGHWR